MAIVINVEVANVMVADIIDVVDVVLDVIVVVVVQSFISPT